MRGISAVQAVRFSAFFAFLAVLAGCRSARLEFQPQLKPRIVVMTDIGPARVEPDDNESAVRLMSYADRFEIEGIITTVGWNCDPYPSEWAEYLTRVTDGYVTDVHNLMKRSNQTEFQSLEQENRSQTLGYWPSAEYVKSRCVMGSQRAGIGVIGPENETEGSRLIRNLLLEDDGRPIWFLAWGSANTLAQAVWRFQHELAPDEFKRILNRIRLYTITDQDMVYAMRMNRDYSSHMWLRENFARDLMLVWDESAWLAQNENGKNDWESYAKYIQGHGAMGRDYPKFLWGVEGDTPSFLHVMPNGLNDPDDPTQVGWGGYHTFALSPDRKTYAWTNWQQPENRISRSFEDRFYTDEFADFAARMEWAETGSGNTNPVLVVNGDSGLAPIEMTVPAGKTVTIDASRSFDPEGNGLSFHWEFQPFAGYDGPAPAISDADARKIKVTMPESDGTEHDHHLILTVHDDGNFSLASYRRVIIHTK